MSLYETGTITGALNATTITGTGTKWSDAKIGITNGSVLFASSAAGIDGVYQIKRVINDTSIELAQPIYKAFTNSKYSILVAEASSTASFANQLAATLGYYQAQIEGWQQIMTGTGDVELTAPDGTKVTIKSFTKMGSDIEKKANKTELEKKANSGENSDIKSITGIGLISHDNLRDDYDYISLPNTNPEGTKLLRKFRSGAGQTIWHETVIKEEYMLSTGVTPTVPILTISNVAGVVYAKLGNVDIIKAGDNGVGSLNGGYLGDSGGMKNVANGWYQISNNSSYPSLGAWAVRYDRLDRNSAVVHAYPMGNPSAPESYRVKTPSGWGDWQKTYGTQNTTVDSNGFIKTASPIIKIFHDGSFETNEESAGASVKREGVGIYRISNILGMNSDSAWGGIDGGFEVPTDRNGQRLLWLDYEVDADGSILVKTYHRTYPEAPVFARNTKDGYEESDPIDVPPDQFLSVRVEMPQDSIWNQAQKAAQEAMAQEQSAEE